MPAYLPRSETFIYNTIQAQRTYEPIVLACHIDAEHAGEFPVERLLELVPRVAIVRKVVRRARSLLGSPMLVDALRNTLRAEPVDIVHAHFGWSGALAAEAGVLGESALLTSFYGRDLSDFRGNDYTDLFRRGQLFLVEGPAMGRRLEELGCRPDSLRVARLGVDLSLLPFRAERGGSRDFVIMQVARFVEKKGLDLSLRAFAELADELPTAELWLVGDGPLRPDLEELAQTLGISERVRFAGMLSHTEYRKLTERVDVCLQPSRTASDGDSEGGAPTVLLEMQALGIPVVATRHADIPFVVAHPDELVAEEDVAGLAAQLLRIAQLAADDKAERALAARQFVEQHHDNLRTTSQIEQYYDEAVALHEERNAATKKELIAGA